MQQCPRCQEVVEDDAKSCPTCLADLTQRPQPEWPAPAGTVPDVPPPGTRLYKVITQRDEFFRSKFNPEALQELLNRHARVGWRVVGLTATDVGSFFGSFWNKGVLMTPTPEGYDAEIRVKSRTATLASGRPVFDAIGCGGRI